MKITQQMHQQSGWTATPSRLIGAPISAIPTIFTPDALPDNHPNLSWLGTGTKSDSNSKKVLLTTNDIVFFGTL